MKISIITATWNSEATLKDTIESVLSQSYEDFEHIIVDGASTDNTLNIIKKYEPAYKGRLKWISEPDKGIYDAMNKGIKLASGDVIGFLNSDDFYYSSTSLQMVASGLKKSEIDAVYADNVIVLASDLNKVVRYHINSDFKVSKMKYGFMPSHPTFYCRKYVFDNLGGFETSYKIAADFDWLLRVLYLGKIKALYQPGYFTKMRTGGVSQQGIKSVITVIKEHLKAYKRNGVKSNILFEFYRLGYKYMCKLLGRSY